MILEILFNLLLTFFIFWIFKTNKTSYILGYSIIIFIAAFVFFIYIGFEFLALAFIITYIGGVAIMFLFLILVLDVNTENTKFKRTFTKSTLFLISLVFCLVFFFSNLILSVYNPFLFNNFDFYELLVEKLLEKTEHSVTYSDVAENFESFKHFKNYHFSMEECWPLYNDFGPNNTFGVMLNISLEYVRNQNFDLLNNQFLSKFCLENNYKIFYNNWSSSVFNFSDIITLGIHIYAYQGILLVYIAVFLFIALIVSIYVGSGIFQIEKI